MMISEWPDTHADAWIGLLETHKRLTRALDAELEAHHGLTLSGFEVLSRLAAGGGERPLRLSAVAAAASLSLSRVSRIVDVLEQRRLVERRPSPDDARAFDAHVTGAGHALVRAGDALRRGQAALPRRAQPGRSEHARGRVRAALAGCRRGLRRAVASRPTMAAPVLWHISFSNYNEKARWALDYKHVAHRRREAPPGLHPLWAWRIGGGRTFPLLVIDDRAIGDSSEIVAELERRVPDPPLYPADPEQRIRALALEDVFDEELGPEVRRVAMDAVRRDPEIALSVLTRGGGELRRRAARLLVQPAGIAVRRYYDVDRETVERAWRRIDAAIERFKAELQPNGYLAGDGFSVADLTFAALIGTAVQPEGFPYPVRDRRRRGLPEVRSLLAERSVLEWIEEMYARHRGGWMRA